MKKISKVAFMLVGIVLLVASCSRKIYIPVEKTVTVTETVRDTVVQVQLEKEYVKVITPDTTSTVETKYARSTATYHGESGCSSMILKTSKTVFRSKWYIRKRK